MFIEQKNDRIFMKNAKNILNDIFAYNVTFVEIFNIYTKQLIEIYQENKNESKMLALLKIKQNTTQKKIEKTFIKKIFATKITF